LVNAKNILVVAEAHPPGSTSAWWLTVSSRERTSENFSSRYFGE
jgi:hypothetical protein